MTTFSIVRVSGSNYDMGFSHGQQCSSLIRSLIQTITQQSKLGISKEELVSRARKYQPVLEDNNADLLDEIKGIADGAKIPYDEILALNLYPDLEPTAYDYCTTFGIAGEFMEDGDLLVAQNADYFSSYDRYTILLQLNSSRGPKISCVTEAGTVGTAGINSEGLIRVGNGIYSKNQKIGVPYYFLRRRMLEQKSVSDVLKIVRTQNRSNSSGHLLADKTGEILYLETTVDDDRVLQPKNGRIAHTNHFVHPDFTKYEQGLVTDSPKRLASIQNRLDSRANFNLNDAKEFLRDHENYPFSICRHEGDMELSGGMRWKTNASILLRSKMRTAYACLGYPCKNEYSKLDFLERA